MALGYSGVVTQARAQKAGLIQEQRQLRQDERREKREIQAEIKRIQGEASAAQEMANAAKTASSLAGAAVGGAVGTAATTTANYLIDKTANAKARVTDSQIDALQDKLTTNSNNRQMRLDEIEQEITACDEQIKDAKKQGQEATKEMFGANG